MHCKPRVVFFFYPQEFHRLQDENFQLKSICEDQEQALEELGSKLSEYVRCLTWPRLNLLSMFQLEGEQKHDN